MSRARQVVAKYKQGHQVQPLDDPREDMTRQQDLQCTIAPQHCVRRRHSPQHPVTKPLAQTFVRHCRASRRNMSIAWQYHIAELLQICDCDVSESAHECKPTRQPRQRLLVGKRSGPLHRGADDCRVNVRRCSPTRTAHFPGWLNSVRGPGWRLQFTWRYRRTGEAKLPLAHALSARMPRPRQG